MTEDLRARDIMTTDVVTVTAHDTVNDVIELLMEKNISGLPVVDENSRVIGIVTEGDLIYRSKKLEIPRYFTILDSYIFLDNTKKMEEQIRKMVGYRVEDIMTRDVVIVDVDETVEEIATIMTRKQVNRVPVTENEKLVGIVTRRDIIRAYASDLEHEKKM
ncbi:CBS domain-containing protein [Anoxynatronum buryatiense]|uniref:CBS domain-containing protein n=1 Tax=Anoxynatronum buryatiense TaxID=489973 RepID=A0AA45WUT3_9CLOT|nr:CBS domain-containing protein [Anoxynatronum buryatiense]SMP44992.1 CBS domain-containing protein [Anoxynatronum buryatiense]